MPLFAGRPFSQLAFPRPRREGRRDILGPLLIPLAVTAFVFGAAFGVSLSPFLSCALRLFVAVPTWPFWHLLPFHVLRCVAPSPFFVRQ